VRLASAGPPATELSEEDGFEGNGKRTATPLPNHPTVFTVGASHARSEHKDGQLGQRSEGHSEGRAWAPAREAG
jgi:hypothetical protein